MHLKADFLPSSVDVTFSREVKFERQRWSDHRPNDANSIQSERLPPSMGLYLSVTRCCSSMGRGSGLKRFADRSKKPSTVHG
jgi:hypothetical protein